MSSDAPEFRTNISTPVSPTPIHIPEIPVLRNQIDPVFNMTSTHIATSDTLDGLQASTELQLAAAANNSEPSKMSNPLAVGGRSPSSIIDDDDMADAYGEEDKVDEAQSGGQAATAVAEEDGSDDYAKMFESDDLEGEAGTTSNTIANPDLDQQLRSQIPPVCASETTSHVEPSPAANTSPSTRQEISSSFAQPISSPTQATGITTASNIHMPPPATHSYEDIANGGIDIQQLLDNITANAEQAEASKSAASATSPKHGYPYSNSGPSSLPAHSGLPPRPQVHSKQPMHSNYVPHDDLRKFHAGPLTPLINKPGAFRPAPLVAGAGAPGTSTDPRSGLPPPPAASFNSPIHLQGPAFPSARIDHLRRSDENGEASTSDGRDETDTPWPARVQKLYDEFLEDERRYVMDGLWDIFPRGSRLFIGNLPTEKVTKRDIFHVFYRYGKIAQIAIKQAYGFVQFHDVNSCKKALQREQAAELRGRKMHLEISKPQKNTVHSIRPGAVRPHSPEQPRERGGERGGRNSYGSDRGVERFDSRPSTSRWQTRDDYRPRRSPSPRGGYRGREDYGRDEFGRDRVRPRTRSRSPYKNRGGYRQRSPPRSPSPRSIEASEDAALAIPTRDPREVPDVQIILMDELDRQFVSWVENEMRGMGIETEVLFLNPRLPLQAVIRRQILEGVTAVTQLSRQSQISSQVPLQLFDHTKSPVTFDQYQDLEPKIAAQLVIRAKQSRVPVPAAIPAYSPPQYAAPQQQAYHPQAPVAPATQAPNLASMVGQLDNDALQKLLLSLNAGNQQQNSQIQPVQQQQAPPIDLAKLLSGFTQQQQQQPQQQLNPMSQPYQPQLQHQQNHPAQQNAYAALAGNPNLAALLAGDQAQGQHTGQQQQQHQQQQHHHQQSQQMMPAANSQVDNIMAQLSRYR